MANLNLLDLLLPYGDRSIKVKAKASGYTDSEFSNSVTYHSAPVLSVDPEHDTVIVISNLRAAATGYEFYINGTLNTTLPYSGADGGTMSVDLDNLSDVPQGSLTITVKGTGTGVESNTSNALSVYYGEGGGEIYGVSGLYQSSPTLTRTDDAVGMSAAVNTSTGAVSSDFDSVFPWNEATVETVGGNKFLKMPDMWFRIGKDASNRITDVAVSKAQGATGDWYKVDSFYYGCYGGSVANSKLASVSGVARQHSATRANFRTYAAANGSGYHQLDLYHHTVMVFLWLIEWANKDSQSIMRGRDATYGNAAVNTGGTDSLSTPSGFNTSTGQMRYHYIEDFVGNYLEWVDGSVGNGTAGGAQYVTADPSKFSDDTTGLNTLAYNSPAANGNCLVSLGWDANNPFLVLPKEVTNDSNYSTYYCDYAATTNRVCLSVGAYWNDSDANRGVTYFHRNSVSFSNTYIGGRLLYKP